MLSEERPFTIAFSLKPAKEYKKGQKFVVLTAAFIEGVRLIDNMLLN